MKPSNGRECEGASPVALPADDQERLAAALRHGPTVPRRALKVDTASWIGLGLALALLGGMIWAVAPTSPVAAELRE